MFLPYLIHIPILIVLILLLKRRLQKDPLSNFYSLGLAFKLISGIALGLIYVFLYQNGDTFYLQHSSSVLTGILLKDPEEFFTIIFTDQLNPESLKIMYYWDEPRAFFFVKILTFLNLFTFSNYWINSLYLSLFSFFGIWILANTIVKIYKVSSITCALAFIFVPSFVFWTSGVMKESVTMGALCIIIALVLQFIHKQRAIHWRELILLVLLSYVCWKIKFYYILVTFPTLLSYYIVVVLKENASVFKEAGMDFVLFIFSFLSIVAIALLVVPGLSIEYISEIIYHSYRVIEEETIAAGKQAYVLEGMGADIFQIIKNAPEALLVGLFRPFVWESKVNIAMLAALENLVILILLTAKIYAFAKKPVKPNIETIALVFYIFLSAILMTLIAPNWGTLMRYKSAYLPFWILFLSVNNPLITYITRPFLTKKNFQ